MKTFSDPNTTIQQEQAHIATFKRRVEILWQYAGEILSRDSATAITVDGDATARFAEGDTLVIPLDAYETNHVITSISYSAMSDSTQITCSASTFAATGLPGLNIAKRLTVSGGNVERLIEMTPIEFENEGETLNEFLASEVSFGFDNGDGYFANSTDTGIFDNTDIHWMRVYGGWRFATDRVLLFGGLVNRKFTRDDRYKKYFKITAQGHIKELERYPAYLLSEPNGDFLKLSGFEIVGVTANDKTFAGVKTLEWNFISRELPGVEILSISKNLGSGLVPLKFRYPNLFKYGWGDWTVVAENTASTNITGADGSVLAIRSTNFDVQDREVFLEIVNDVNARVNKSGEIEVTFDNGLAAKISPDFDGVIAYDGASYSDVSNDNDGEGLTYEVLDDGSAAIYLFSKEPFFGFELFIDSSDLIGTIDLAFSNGLDSWQAIASPTDTTADFTQDGVITWTEAEVTGWRPVTFQQAGIYSISQKFGLRIDLSAYTSGSVTILSLRRYYKVFAANGTELAFKLDFHEVPAVTVKEDVILRQIAETWTACMWYRNISMQRVMELLLAQANYSASNYTLDDLKLQFQTPRLHIIGQAPAPFYKKKCKALLWDSGNEVLYLGIGDEFWSVTETGEFTFIDRLQRYNEASEGYGLVEFSIRNMAFDGTTIHGMAWWDKYDDMIFHQGDINAGFYVRMFKYSGGTFEVLNVSTAQAPLTIGALFINPAEQHMRKGLSAGSVPNFVTYLGHDDGDTVSAGENICIPFMQVLRDYRDVNYPDPVGQVISDAGGFVTGSKAADPTFYFGLDWPDTPNKGKFFLSRTNHYFMHQDGEAHTSQRWTNFHFRLGNKGLFPYAASNGFIVYQMNRDADTRNDEETKIVKLSVDQSLTEIYDFAEDSSKQPLHGIIISGFLWVAYMSYDDDGDDPSACILAKIELATGTYTEIFDFSADSAEAGQSITGDEPVMTILEFAYNADENTLHGCLLNRENFEYHYFVYSIADDELYATQTGSGFTFDKHRQYVDFVEFDDEVYAVCVDRRYQVDQAFLTKGVFSAGTITLTRIDAIDESWDHLTMHATADAIFGVTGNGKLWKYGTEFYPRIAHGNFGRKNLREVMTDVCQALNRVVNFRANRKVRIVAREAYDGSKTLYEDKHIQALRPIETWRHYYDRVNVSWRDPVSGENGAESFGTEGWENLELNIENPLIQNRQLAAAVAESYFDFFSTPRKLVTGRLVPMLELEEYDRVKFIVKRSRTDIPRDIYYRLVRVSFDPDQLYVDFEALS